MGCWGPGLYSNDDAVAIRDVVKSLVRLPKDGEELLGLLKTYYHADGEDADDYSILHLVVADQFHRYGIACDPLFALAKNIVESGIDDRLMAALEMSAADRRKRGRQLEMLLKKWEMPPERSASRKILRAPQKHPLEPGDICIYPTADFIREDISHRAKANLESSGPTGWAAFVVARNEHRLGLFSVSYILRLFVDGPDQPDFEACRSAPIAGELMRSWGWTEPRYAIGWALTPGNILKTYQAKKIGTVNLSWEKIRARFPESTKFDPLNDPPELFNILTVTNKMLSDNPAEWDIGVPLDIRLSDFVASKGD